MAGCEEPTIPSPQTTGPSGLTNPDLGEQASTATGRTHLAERPFLPLLADDPREVGGYSLRARIGQGGMGTVFLSTSRAGRPIALKLVRPEFADSPDFRSRFAAEVAIAQRVQGAYTVPVVDADTDADRPWIATSYVPAPNLSTVVRQAGPLPPRTVLGLIAGVAEALESIHQAKVIHRDLKPANVITAADGPLVIDFGLARATEGAAGAFSRPGLPVGTPAFMSPEQVSDGRVDRPSDIFSLGSTAYFAATGQYPFGGDIAVFHRIEYTEPDWQPVPWPLRLVLNGCLAKSPAHRPSCEEIIDLCHRLSLQLEVRDASATVPAAQRGLLGEGWLPDTITAEISRYRLAAATTLPQRTTRRTETQETATCDPTVDLTSDSTAEGATAEVRHGRLVIGIAAGSIGLLLVVAAILVAFVGRGHSHATISAPSASPTPVATVTTEPPLTTPTSSPSVRPTLPSASPRTTAAPPPALSAPPTQDSPSATPAPGPLDILLGAILPSAADASPSTTAPATTR